VKNSSILNLESPFSEHSTLFSTLVSVRLQKFPYRLDVVLIPAILATQQAEIREDHKANSGKKFRRAISSNKSWVWHCTPVILATQEV
jgi:hypothetical protein